MTLPTLNWHFSGWQPFSDTSTTTVVLDDIADWLNDATSDVHGSRVAGSGSAWTAIKEDDSGTVAIRLVPPTTSAAPNQRVIIAGVDAGSPTPPMFGSDTFATGVLIAGLGCEITSEVSYNSWDNATPYSSGTFSTYGRFGPGVSNLSSFAIVESEEGINVWLRHTNDSIYPMTAGALPDPFSSSLSDAHADGRRYMIAISGTAAINITTHSGSNVNGLYFANRNNFGGAKNIVRNLNDTWSGISSCTLTARNDTTASTSAPTSSEMKNTSNSVGERFPVWLKNTGRLRQIFIVPDEVCGSLVGNPAAYITLSNSIASQTDAFGFEI